MQTKHPKKVDPSEVSEVIEFLDAQDALQAFKEENAAVLEQLAALSERYNTALEQAEKVCRSREVGCGPIDLYQFSVKYNASALFNAVGRDQFLVLGGETKTVTEYSLDKGRFEAAVEEGTQGGRDPGPQGGRELPRPR
jgi:hypothetical protein